MELVPLLMNQKTVLFLCFRWFQSFSLTLRRFFALFSAIAPWEKLWRLPNFPWPFLQPPYVPSIILWNMSPRVIFNFKTLITRLTRMPCKLEPFERSPTQPCSVELGSQIIGSIHSVHSQCTRKPSYNWQEQIQGRRNEISKTLVLAVVLF